MAPVLVVQQNIKIEEEHKKESPVISTGLFVYLTH
jgi:hypothetical protein